MNTCLVLSLFDNIYPKFKKKKLKAHILHSAVMLLEMFPVYKLRQLWKDLCTKIFTVGFFLIKKYISENKHRISQWKIA